MISEREKARYEKNSHERFAITRKWDNNDL